MTAYLIVCAVLVVIAAVVIALTDFDRPVAAVLVAIALAIMLALAWAVSDSIYEYSAFPAITACEAQRMEARVKPLSTRVVCVPAYRATRNDSLTVSTPELRGRTP